MRSLLLIATVAIASAQTQPAFEAASVKPANSDDNTSSYTKYGEAMGSLQFLIRYAYGIEDYRISGGPKWLDADKFSVVFKPVTPQVNLMLRTLLAERFKLSVHTETRQLPVYSMVIAKSGPKMEKATDASRAGGWGSGMVRGTMEMPEPASHLSSILGRKVTDQTGLTGAYKLSMTWTPDDRPATGDNSPPSLVTAIQEQLGLRLESTKGPVDILVVDHAEKPTEN